MVMCSELCVTRLLAFHSGVMACSGSAAAADFLMLFVH